MTFSRRGLCLAYGKYQNTRIYHQDMIGLRLSFICIGVGQGNSTRGPEEFVRNEALLSFLRNYLGSRVEFPCPIPILFLTHFVTF